MADADPEDVNLAALGGPPPADKLERAVARAKIEAALFASTETVALGRYHLLEKVGEGGMGVVWGAYDPELDRRVAIKLVRAELAAARERILAEGQALAKLAHPNVVAIHDVGLLDEQVYIVMEWVRGQTLRGFANAPTAPRLRELVAVYRAAGEGLAAIHRAGLVHRDFKPDNAILGDDGRVRVLDFGLARGALADGDAAEPRIAGTPRYMAPEQAAGLAVTAAADQYAFCVALRESIAAIATTVPGWLEAICVRGTAAEPTNRYPSMAELLRDLARDPRTVWRRRLLVAGALGAIGAAFVVGSVSERALAIEPCIGGPEEIAPLWNPAVRDRLAAHLRTLGAYGTSEAARVGSALDAYGASWIAAHRGACLAQERRELTPQLYERNVVCLERSRAAYGTVVDVLGRSTAPQLPDAVLALGSLPDVDRCLAESRTSLVEPPPRAIADEVARVDGAVEQGRIRVLAADPTAVAELTKLAAAAKTLAYMPLVGRAHLVLGFALNRVGQMQAAIPILEQAATASLEGGDDVASVEALARHVYAVGRMGPGPPSLDIASAVAKRLRANGSFVRPLLYNNTGVARLAANDEAGARTWYQRAREDWLVSRDPAVELMFIPSNLALVTESQAEQQRLIEESASRFEATLGVSHPTALEFRVRAAMSIAHPGEAARKLADACGALRRLHPHLVVDVVACTYEEGWLADERGDARAARAAYAIPGAAASGQLHVRLARIRLAALANKVDEALRDAIPLARELEATTTWWTRLFAADALLIEAALHDERGSPKEALAALQRARSILENRTVGHSQTYHQRRLARVHRLLARRLGAADLAASALDWYREAGGYEAAVTELEAIVVRAPR